MNIESRGGSLPPKSSDEWRAELRLRNNVGQNFSPQVSYSCLPCYVNPSQTLWLGCPAEPFLQQRA